MTTTTTTRSSFRFLLVAMLAAACVWTFQLNWRLLSVMVVQQDGDDYSAPFLSKQQHQQQQQEGMAACLMVKDDNALLPEWIAYHYIILPLRHLVIGSDINCTQNVSTIVQKWQQQEQHVPIHVIVWEAPRFVHAFGDIEVSLQDDPNHHYLHRQRAFLASCAQYMKEQNQTWVALVDTDEYIAINQGPTVPATGLLNVNSDNGNNAHVNTTSNNQDERNSSTATIIATRQRQAVLQRLQSQSSNNTATAMTVLEALQTAHVISPLAPCHGMPRLLFGALTNVTCDEDHRSILHNVQHVLVATNDLPTTIQHVQHATKGAFYPSKWGKVLVDVSRLSWSSLRTKPRSSHRPFPECPKPLFSFDTALLQVNHYLGSWERYDARAHDDRRSKAAFDERASLSNGDSCQDEMWRWFPTFVESVGGTNVARELLRIDA